MFLMKSLLIVSSFVITILFSCLSNSNEQNLELNAIQACIAEVSIHASDDVTVGELRKQCHKKIQDPIKKRLALEKSASNNPFAILPHKPNYILPFTYFDANQTPYGDLLQGRSFDDFEAKFQVSLKYKITEDLFFKDLDLNAAYTATSWWQSYNSDISAVFRETNYEPELILSYSAPWSLFGVNIDHSTLAFNHQSNGQAGILSRSWNRLIAGITVVDEDLIWNLKAWYRIPEDEKVSDGSPEGDDNPNIENYMGYGELGILWKINEQHNIDFLLRNNLKSDNKGAIQIGWSFPLSKHLRGYVEYFNGYGESLIYYNENISRIGFGVKLTDWL
jgi:phospholipase A1